MCGGCRYVIWACQHTLAVTIVDTIACHEMSEFRGFLGHLEGPTGPLKFFLTPAKGGGVPSDACDTGGTAVPSAASPSVLAGGRRMAKRRQRWTERGLSTRECTREACVVILCNLLMDYN